MIRDNIKRWIDEGDVEKVLYLNNLEINEFPNIPSNVKYLDISNNNITYIGEIPKNLVKLNISNNRLIYLPEMNEQLRILNCSINHLETIKISYNLMVLDCSYNQLTKCIIPDHNINLSILHIESNKIKRIEYINNKLEELYCSFNELEDLPNLKNLLILNCSKNKLTELPKIPKTMFNLNCIGNQINIIVIPEENVLINLECDDDIIYRIYNEDSVSDDILDENMLFNLDCGDDRISNEDSVSDENMLINLDCDDEQSKQMLYTRNDENDEIDEVNNNHGDLYDFYQ